MKTQHLFTKSITAILVKGRKKVERRKGTIWRFASGMALAAAVAFAPPTLASDSHDNGGSAVGALFVASNSTAPGRGNEVRMFNRFDDGSLDYLASFATGGVGSGPGTLFAGDALGSQGSMVATEDGKFLLLTNFSTNDISVFRISRSGLVLTDVEPSGGEFPVGVTVHENLVYVLNSGGRNGLRNDTFNARVVGFRLSDDGDLRRIRGSGRNLRSKTPALSDPNLPLVPHVLFSASEVRFSPNGKHLAVVIKATTVVDGLPAEGRIDIARVRNNGRLRNFVRNESPGLVPFALNFSDNSRQLYVVEAIGDFPRAAISSYRIRGNGRLAPISESVPLSLPGTVGDTLDTCWVVRVDNFLYTANFFSNTVSIVEILPNGSLQPFDEAATSSPPVFGPPADASTFDYNLDLAVSPDGNYLYNLLPGAGTIAGFRVAGSSAGSLDLIGFFDGLNSSPLVADPAAQPPGELLPLNNDGGSPAGAIAVDFGDDDDDDDDED